MVACEPRLENRWAHDDALPWTIGADDRKHDSAPDADNERDDNHAGGNDAVGSALVRTRSTKIFCS